MKSKQDLINEAARLAKLHQQKKDAIERIFSDLDKEEKVTPKHLGGISAVNEILKELKQLEEDHEKIYEQIKVS